jgi:type I restriction enzyme S subunit
MSNGTILKRRLLLGIGAYREEKSWIINLSIVLAVDPRVIDKKYLYYRLSMEPLKKRLNPGAAQAQITIENLARYRISIPNFDVQKRVSDILSSYDDLIENNRRRIALQEEAARVLYGEWFVRFRFPGHEHVKIVEGLPQGNRVKEVRDKRQMC